MSHFISRIFVYYANKLHFDLFSIDHYLVAKVIVIYTEAGEFVTASVLVDEECWVLACYTLQFRKHQIFKNQLSRNYLIKT